MCSSIWKTQYYVVDRTTKWKRAFSPFPLLCYFRGGGNSTDGGMKTERVQDQKEKMLAELQLLWKEQCDHLRKKKEQFATEVCSDRMEGLLPGASIQQSTLKSRAISGAARSG